MSDDGTSFDYTTLLISEPEAGVVLCTFNRPESRNALGLEMVNVVIQERESATTGLTIGTTGLFVFFNPEITSG